ncbi:serine hydrolase domain-containing protein [Lunatibacter salilacus]|uniref:serine hydrolase domain-containing protein n=1 Tax=Lunatibacter salilacus TaxID=2483804 RepID=UPI00131A79CC|nr:serine hydrolase [Lunatibacter salilacus]
MKFNSLLFIFLSGCFFHLQAQDGTSLPRSGPSSQLVASSNLLDFISAVEDSSHEMHSLMVLRNGNVVAEGWWTPYAPTLKHTLYSTSKTFTATAVGFAVQENLLKVEDRVIDYFPESLPDSISPNLSALRIKHLLSMSVGHEPEYTTQVVTSDDWVKTFLSQPITHAPGSKFLYNTAATYILAALVERVSRERLVEYLTPRLFDPLGISGVDWEVDPKGIATGGYGLRVKTEDMAKLGQLFLQEGSWHGKQLISPNWIEAASSSQIIQDPTAPAERVDASDWLQGYGYQMWRSRHDSYRADGAFGQYILVLPRMDAVIAITSETSNMQGLIDLVWEHLLPAFDGEVSNEDDQKLKGVLSDLAIRPKEGVANSKVELSLSGNRYGFEGKVQELEFTFKNDKCEVFLVEDGETFRFTLGRESWVGGTTDRKGPYLVARAKGAQEGLAPFKVNGSYTWEDTDTLILQLNYTESPHTETFKIIFEGEGAEMTQQSIINSRANEEPIPIHGKLILETVNSF